MATRSDFTKNPTRASRSAANPILLPANGILAVGSNNPLPSIQPKIFIGSPTDRYEREAETLAKPMMGIPENSFSFQRKCADCVHEKIQQKPFDIRPLIQKSGNESLANETISRQIESSRGGGSSMAENTRSFMESRLGNDFSGVKIHTDSNASRLSQNLNAQAFTVGREVFFNEGKYDPASDSGRHLLAHELVHVMQQGGRLMRKVEPDSPKADPIEACLSHKEGDILPRGVGLVEHINREVILTDLLGEDRESLEQEIRKNKNTHRFVCEFGIAAIATLYYTRDSKKRIDLRKSKLELLHHWDDYTVKGLLATKDSKAALEKRYGIFIQRADKDWSPQEIIMLKTALEQLSDPEANLIKGYRFIRWTNECNKLSKQNPDYSCSLDDYDVLGRHSSVADGENTITMYDGFQNKEAENGFKNTILPGSNTILHEMGHAMYLSRLAKSTKEYYFFKREYDREKIRLQTVSASDKKAYQARLKAIENNRNRAAAVMSQDLKRSDLQGFKRLIKDKIPFTVYSTTDIQESFAEAFMLFKVDPQGLKQRNKKLYAWFERGGFI